MRNYSSIARHVSRSSCDLQQINIASDRRMIRGRGDRNWHKFPWTFSLVLFPSLYTVQLCRRTFEEPRIFSSFLSRATIVRFVPVSNRVVVVAIFQDVPIYITCTSRYFIVHNTYYASYSFTSTARPPSPFTALFGTDATRCVFASANTVQCWSNRQVAE